MSNTRFNLLSAIVCLVAFAALYTWQTPGAGSKLGVAEIDRYLAQLAQLPMPEAEKAAALARIRAWAEADDGKPFCMLNLMRYYGELRRYPGAPDFQGTPRQANDYYESVALKLLLKSGSYPLLGGSTQGRDVLDASSELDDWSRVLVVRYRSRRAFLDLLTDPAYAPVMPYKLMALSVVLVPVSGELVLPDIRWLAGALLLALFLLAGWIRASKRSSRPQMG
jgi:hypothetical protein